VNEIGVVVSLLNFQNNFNVITDRSRIQQVVLNLYSNALKFTKPKGTITITCRRELDEAARQSLRISIADTGVGISDEDQAKLF